MSLAAPVMSSSVESLPTHESDAVRRDRMRRRNGSLAVFAVLAALAVVFLREVPSWMDSGIQRWAQDRYKWSITNRQTSPVFRWLFNPLTDFLTWSVEHTETLLLDLRWPGVVALIAAIGWRTGGVQAALAGAGAMVGVGVIADFDPAMRTLAIMTVSVVIALVIGIPLGVLSARSDRLERVLRVVLDTAQVLPIFVYFSPVQLFFGLKFAPAVVVTVVYALPPAVRLTNLGLRQVPVVANEVGHSFGATSLQQLFKVQLPLAKNTILLGLNQVIMMAFAIVVLASLLGTGDLGQSVLAGLQKQHVGQAFAAGMGIVLMAVALDRVSTGRPERPLSRQNRLPAVPRNWITPISVAAVALVVVLANAFDWRRFPSSLTYDISSPIDSAVDWVQRNLRKDVPIIGGTQAISDFLVIRVLNPMKEFLLWLPWLVIVVGIAFIGWLSRGWRLAATIAVCLLLIATMGTIPGGGGQIQMWDHAMDTLSQVLVAIALSVLIAFPLGVWAGRSDAVHRVLRPFLDIAQVLPQFVYLIPVVFLFSIGRAAGVVACVVYAVPPCIRLTALGMREVPTSPREAAISFGATGGQEMRRVQLPLARKAILLGINQTLLMVLATVIIAALVGAGALGLVSYEATSKPNLKFGQGVAGGLSIVLLAIMLDRLTQAWGTRPNREEKQSR
ncbi:MAG: ABC transporter permease subunit [Actinobacteria bacterium]|nr:ABC transporter permease subunit [Actinomycetota bacterium]